MRRDQLVWHLFPTPDRSRYTALAKRHDGTSSRRVHVAINCEIMPMQLRLSLAGALRLRSTNDDGKSE